MEQRILIFRIGSLGDTLVSVPAMWTVRENFPNAHVTLLCDHHPRQKYVLGADLLAGTQIVDDVMLYPVIRHGINRFLRPLRMLKLMWALRRRRFDTLVYLVPSDRPESSVQRDRRFFQLAGIQRFIGMEGFERAIRKTPGQAMAMAPRESDLLLKRLEFSGLTIPPEEQRRTDIDVRAAEDEQVDRWVKSLPSDGGRAWMAVGPGSKMPAKIWPADRYEQVVQRLIERYDVWPVIFGGPEDRRAGERLLSAWGRGYNAAGALPLRASAAAIGRAVIYLGNDTGTMHLAAAAGVRCVAIFCSHAPPGLWYPIGKGHRVFRTSIECENCALMECVERRMECILRITADEVYQGCAAVLDEIGVVATDANNAA